MSAVTPLDLTSRRVLLTGAGSGIGRRLAMELATRGAQLVLVGRHEQPLTETATMVGVRGGSAHVLTADLTAPGAPERVVGSALELLGGMDVLINNAGNVRAGRLDEVDAADILAMLALNLTAPILLTKAALPHLRAAATAHGGAAVLGISSGIALVGLPFYATYAATKAGLARFDEALRRELIGTGIRVATAYPGATDTAMMATSQAGDRRRPRGRGRGDQHLAAGPARNAGPQRHRPPRRRRRPCPETRRDGGRHPQPPQHLNARGSRPVHPGEKSCLHVRDVEQT